MSKQCNYKESVLDHLPDGFNMIVASLEDEKLAYDILGEASANFTARQGLHLHRIRDQKSSRSPGKTKAKDVKTGRKWFTRKTAAFRSYTPTDATLFQWLVKRALETEER